MTLARLFPPLDWARGYGRASLASDATAAAIVTIMLIPQSLAYAMLAGLPPETGLYASIAPLLLYALFGSSRTLSVGPVAVLSLMTASALAGLPEGERLAGAAVLAALVGAILLGMGAMRLGLLANFLSHPVISGFIAASALLIATSQIGQILGIGARGETLVELVPALAKGLGQINFPTLALGGATVVFLV